MQKITVQDVENIVGFQISENCKKMILEFDLQYEYLEKNERDNIILKILNGLNSSFFDASGSHRLEKWENGWKENLDLLKSGASTKDLVPKYFGKYDIVRWNRDFVKTNNKYFDYYQSIILLDAILHHYVGTGYQNLFEFGCGPAYHLLRFSEFNKDINLLGLDWTRSSQEIIQQIQELEINQKISGKNFNFFSPDYEIEIPENSAIFTSSALEQVGENYKDFVDFLLRKKPELCINFEPLEEFLDQSNLIDYLCIQYSKKRNYLSGYLTHLENLEKLGRIEILYKRRFYSGSLYLEGQSAVVWRPTR